MALTLKQLEVKKAQLTTKIAKLSKEAGEAKEALKKFNADLAAAKATAKAAPKKAPAKKVLKKKYEKNLSLKN